MGKSAIEALVKEALDDLSLPTLTIDHVLDKAGLWGVLISDARGFYALSLDAHKFIERNVMKAEIIRQLRGVRLVA